MSEQRDREQAIEKIAQELFDIWVEAKSDLPDGDDWNNQTWETLPEKHRVEYIKTATRIFGYRLIPELKPLSDEEVYNALSKMGWDKIGLAEYMDDYWEDYGKDISQATIDSIKEQLGVK